MRGVLKGRRSCDVRLYVLAHTIHHCVYVVELDIRIPEGIPDLKFGWDSFRHM